MKYGQNKHKITNIWFKVKIQQFSDSSLCLSLKIQCHPIDCKNTNTRLNYYP